MEIVAIISALAIIGIGSRVLMSHPAMPGHYRQSKRNRHRNVPLPILIIPTSPGASDILPAGVVRDRGPTGAEPLADAPVPDEPEIVRESEIPAPAAREVEREIVREVVHEHGVKRPREAVPGHRTRLRKTDPADATIAFDRRQSEAMQVLPGRLHVLSGENAGKDLRLFSKVGERPRIVVGREAGPLNRHITFRSPTVSRRHARMEFIDGQWTITNLSATNPVLVNDRALTDESSAKTLSNGDRIELGEIALRFLAS